MTPGGQWEQAASLVQLSRTPLLLIMSDRGTVAANLTCISANPPPPPPHPHPCKCILRMLLWAHVSPNRPTHFCACQPRSKGHGSTGAGQRKYCASLNNSPGRKGGARTIENIFCGGGAPKEHPKILRGVSKKGLFGPAQWKIAFLSTVHYKGDGEIANI